MDAADILQSYLDEVSQAVMSGDWDTYRDGICLPCHIISHHESKVVATEDDLRDGWTHFRDMLQIQRVTDYVRLVESASRLDKELISGRYVSHVISGSHRLIPPFRSDMTLRLVGNRWRVASLTNGLANSRWPLMRLELPTDTNPEGSKE
jgi:hypothetical protein